MLKSCICPLANKSSEFCISVGECPYDLGGYYIISGKEKVIGPLIPIAPAIEDIVVAETQVFGEIAVVVDGQKVDPLIQTSENSVNLKVGDIVMDLGGSSESGNKLPIIDGILLLEPKGSIGLKGNGFKKNTSIAICLVQNLSKATGGRLSEFNPYLQSRLTEENNSFLYHRI